MPLVNIIDMLSQATQKGYGVAAFNVENLETIQGVIQAAKKTGAPIIIQTTPSSIKYAGIANFYGMVKGTIEEERIKSPVALHLDHGSSFELAVKAIHGGYSSVMIDGSQLPVIDNIELTNRVTSFAHILGVSVEAELGSIGGKEDELEIDESGMTDPSIVARFVNESGCDAFAVAIGTAHGFYKGEPKLDLDRLSQIRNNTDKAIVLHGTSGVPADIVQKCIELGVSKVNYATDLRVAFTKALRDSVISNPEKFDPKVHLKLAREAVVQVATDRILMLSRGRSF
jgi:tagatose 1,6-diphosphate aldolase GatY/KbaY